MRASRDHKAHNEHGRAEVHAVVGRMERERVLARVLINAAREALTLGPWRRVNVSPELKVLSFDQRLARAAREEGVG